MLRSVQFAKNEISHHYPDIQLNTQYVEQSENPKQCISKYLLIDIHIFIYILFYIFADYILYELTQSQTN